MSTYSSGSSELAGTFGTITIIFLAFCGLPVYLVLVFSSCYYLMECINGDDENGDGEDHTG